MRATRALPLLLLALAAAQCLGQYEYDYGYGYDFYDVMDGDVYQAYDEYGYYGDDNEVYYEYYGYPVYGYGDYEDYQPDEYDSFEECFLDATGKPVLANGTVSCDIKIADLDRQAAKLRGGLDGVYQMVSCYNGKPMYTRVNSRAGEERVLWYSSTFGDWDVSKGSEPNEAEILLYGGEMEHASVPLYVSSWHLAGDLRTDVALGEDDYLPVSVDITCADGTTPEHVGKSKPVLRGPGLTDAEMDVIFYRIYDKYSKKSDPTINFSVVVLLVMTGLTVVLAIPYFLLRKKGGKGSSGMSFAQLLTQSKKKAISHIN